jgi:hypothetical protein
VDFLNYKQVNITTYLHKPRKERKVLRTYQEDNPVYHLLKNERNTKHVLDFILTSVLPRSTTPHSAPKTRRLFTSHSTKSDRITAASKCKAELDGFRGRAQSIFEKMTRMTEEMKHKKKQLLILDSYNKMVDKYVSYIPASPEENRESLYANDKLVQLCFEDFFPQEESLHKRAASLLTYNEPKIPKSKLRVIRRRYQTHSLLDSDDAPLKRLNTDPL